MRVTDSERCYCVGEGSIFGTDFSKRQYEIGGRACDIGFGLEKIANRFRRQLVELVDHAHHTRDIGDTDSAIETLDEIAIVHLHP